MRSFSTRALPIAIAVATSPAHAGPPLEPHPEQPAANEPDPGEESGRTDVPETDSAGRVFLRGALFVPKLLTEAVLLPVRTTVYVYDRYDLDNAYYNVFYIRDRDLGIVPTGAYATGLGLSIGGELISKDTFGQREGLIAGATWGGTYRMTANAWLDSGRRFGRFKAQIGGNFDRRPDEPFWGIGNKDEGPRPDMLIPATFPNAVDVRFRYQEARAMATLSYDVFDDVFVAARGAFTELKYTRPTQGIPLDDVYDPMSVVGFDTTTKHVYAEGELRWDRRRRVSIWEPVQLHAEGTLANGFGGYVKGLDGASNFWHYGVDLQQFVRLAPGPRMIEFRLFGEGVTGDLDEVPITELPYLGGDFLRGYRYGRFRDRVAIFGTAQYFWDVSKYADAYIFTDVGRVYRSVEDIALSHMRAGFGAGMELHTDYEFLLEAFIATSVDGGVVVSAALTPIFDAHPRWR